MWNWQRVRRTLTASSRFIRALVRIAEWPMSRLWAIDHSLGASELARCRLTSIGFSVRSRSIAIRSAATLSCGNRKAAPPTSWPLSSMMRPAALPASCAATIWLPPRRGNCMLYRALHLRSPDFAHVPLVVGPDGRRLAKRHGDTRLSAIRAMGVAAEQVLGLLAWSCGWQSDRAPISAAELIPRFDLAAIPPRPFLVTAELLAEIGYSP